MKIKKKKLSLGRKIYLFVGITVFVSGISYLFYNILLFAWLPNMLKNKPFFLAAYIQRYFLYVGTEFNNLILSRFNIRLIFDRRQPQVSHTLYLKMSIEVFYATDYSFAFRHVRTSSKSYSIPFLAWLDSCMRFMSVTPGSTSINKCFELAGYVCPI